MPPDPPSPEHQVQIPTESPKTLSTDDQTVDQSGIKQWRLTEIKPYGKQAGRRHSNSAIPPIPGSADSLELTFTYGKGKFSAKLQSDGGDINKCAKYILEGITTTDRKNFKDVFLDQPRITAIANREAPTEEDPNPNQSLEVTIYLKDGSVAKFKVPPSQGILYVENEPFTSLLKSESPVLGTLERQRLWEKPKVVKIERWQLSIVPKEPDFHCDLDILTPFSSNTWHLTRIIPRGLIYVPLYYQHSSSETPGGQSDSHDQGLQQATSLSGSPMQLVLFFLHMGKEFCFMLFQDDDFGRKMDPTFDGKYSAGNYVKGEENYAVDFTALTTREKPTSKKGNPNPNQALTVTISFKDKTKITFEVKASEGISYKREGPLPDLGYCTSLLKNNVLGKVEGPPAETGK